MRDKEQNFIQLIFTKKHMTGFKLGLGDTVRKVLVPMLKY